MKNNYLNVYLRTFKSNYDMTVKRKFDDVDLDIDHIDDIELYCNFTKKLCIEDESGIDFNIDTVTDIPSDISESGKLSIQSPNYSSSKNYFINFIKQQTVESITIIQHDMGSKEFLKSVYDRYLNILDKLEIYNTDITLEIVKFFELYNIWLDTLKISDVCTSREIMCRLFSIILNIDSYFVNYYFK